MMASVRKNTTSSTHGIIATSTLCFHETEHGRLRRKQRGIDKKDLQGAIRYGTIEYGKKRRNGHSTFIYKYKDIVYIVDAVTQQEITCYAEPIPLETIHLSNLMMLEYEQQRKKVKNDISCWTSNNVIVIDTSGSMKTSDVWGARNRLGAVLISVALDFIAYKIENGEGKMTDMISIITLCDVPQIILEEEPCSWVTYNKIVTIYMNNILKPKGHGPFIPALTLAETLLCRYNTAACVPTLIFLSDGSPSDYWLRNITREEQDTL